MWFDATVVESVVESTPLWVALVMLFVSYLGSIYVIGPATALVYLRGTSERTATWLGIVIGAYALFVFVKPLTDVPRPNVESPMADVALPIVLDQLHYYAVEFDTGSFPSGHAIAATVFYGLLALDFDIGTRRQRFASAIVMVSLIGLSRVVLGVHYVEDIIGGALMGVIFLLATVELRKRVSNPVEITLGLAAALAIAGILGTRTVDGSVLLVACAIAFVGHRRLDLRGGVVCSILRRRLSWGR